MKVGDLVKRRLDGSYEGDGKPAVWLVMKEDSNSVFIQSLRTGKVIRAHKVVYKVINESR